MVERQRRLLEVYAHLHDHCGVHTQKDLAHILRYSRVYISSALNGNEKNLTDKLFKSICEAFPETFNLNYLLTGEGDYLSGGVVLWSEYPDRRTDRTAQRAEGDCRACKLSWNNGRTDVEHLRTECCR